MRSSLIIRLLVAIGLIATIGVPGLEQFDLDSVSAQPATYAMPAGDAWTGLLAVPAAADASEPTEGLIVRFRPRAARSVQVSAHVAAGARRADALALSDTVRVEVPAGQRDSALAAYNARADVLYAEPDYEVRALLTPNDPQFSSQWALTKVGAPAAWDTTLGSSAVKVAVVDCGVFSDATGRQAPDGQAGHPDLRGRVALNQDFTSSSTGFDDYCNHGTHVAGIIGAAQNNGVGISGLAPQISLLNAKVLNDSGSGQTSSILNGVIWAVQNGAKVVNLSLGRDGACTQSERDTMNWAWSQGAVVVAAAGNSGLSSSGSPANCDNVISVASTTTTDGRSSFSNYGTGVDVAAPGSSILSTIRTGEYASFNGTSMASPYVAALAGLIWSQNTGQTAQSVVDRIRTTSDPITGTGTAWAWGRINAAAAVSGGGSPPATSTATAGPTSTSVPPTTLTPVPVPTRIACPSPRPPITVSTIATSANNFTVTVGAGAGVIREIGFSSLRNASVTVGGLSPSSSPFTYQPAAYGNSVSFEVTRVTPNQGWTINLSVSDDCGPWTTFVGGGATTGPRGSVTGTVRNASTSQPVAGATVTAQGSGRMASTGGDGTFIITEVPVGNVNFEVSATGYSSKVASAVVQANQSTVMNVDLVGNAPSLPEISIALTWGNSPADLDIHMSGPTTGSSRFHLYWNNQNPPSHGDISDDDHDGGGPEMITIRRSQSTGNWVAGEYRVWAHNYSGNPSFSPSSARVTVSRGGQQLGVYNVSSATGSRSSPLWRSVNLSIDTSGNVTVTPVQTLVNGGSSTILSIPDGSDGAVEWPVGGKP